jgi:hypothetical protein
MSIGQILPRDVVRPTSEAELDAYRLPFEEPGSRVPVCRWSLEIPMEGEPADVVRSIDAYSQWLRRHEIPEADVPRHTRSNHAAPARGMVQRELWQSRRRISRKRVSLHSGEHPARHRGASGALVCTPLGAQLIPAAHVLKSVAFLRTARARA